MMRIGQWPHRSTFANTEDETANILTAARNVKKSAKKELDRGRVIKWQSDFQTPIVPKSSTYGRG